MNWPERRKEERMENQALGASLFQTMQAGLLKLICKHNVADRNQQSLEVVSYRLVHQACHDSQYIPFSWRYPLATSLAMYLATEPSEFLLSLKIHLQHITFL